MRSRIISRGVHRSLAIGLVAFAQAAFAQGRAPDPQGPQTPHGWSYELKDGRRVPKINRVTNPDGSWREEVRQGNCVTVRERAATGEYKETRQCNPGKPGEPISVK
jgi:hypothetical protein